MDERVFMRNVKLAREAGYDLVCSECGCGMNDEDFEDEDAHETGCSNRGRDRLEETMAMLRQRGIDV